MAPEGSPSRSASASRGSLRRACRSRYASLPLSVDLDGGQATSAPVVGGPPPARTPTPPAPDVGPAAAAAPRGGRRAAAPHGKRTRDSRGDPQVAAGKAKAQRRTPRSSSAAPAGHRQGDDADVAVRGERHGGGGAAGGRVPGLQHQAPQVLPSANPPAAEAGTDLIDLEDGAPPRPVPPDGGQLPYDLTPPHGPNPPGAEAGGGLIALLGDDGSPPEDPVPVPRRASTGKNVNFRNIQIKSTKPEWNPPDNPRLTWLALQAAKQMVTEAGIAVTRAGWHTPHVTHIDDAGKSIEVMDDGRVPHAARDKSHGLPWMRRNKSVGKEAFRKIFFNLFDLGHGGVRQELEELHQYPGPWKLGPDPLYDYTYEFIKKAKRPTERNDGVSGGDADDTNGTGSSVGAQRARDVLHLAWEYKSDELVGICNDWGKDVTPPAAGNAAVAKHPREEVGRAAERIAMGRKTKKMPAPNVSSKPSEEILYPQMSAMVRELVGGFSARQSGNTEIIQPFVQMITAMHQQNQQTQHQQNQAIMGLVQQQGQILQSLLPEQRLPPPHLPPTSSGWQGTYQPLQSGQAAEEAVQPQPQPGQAKEVVDLNELDNEKKQAIIDKWTKELTAKSKSNSKF